MVKKIILVFKTHFDIGFTDLAENVIHSYGSDMLRQVLETCRSTEDMGPLRYVWTMPAWPLWYICAHCDPALKPELDRRIANGQIVWHALPFTSHTDLSAPEEMAESLRYSRALARQYGKPMPISAKMTDVPGHGLLLPEILSQTGIRFLHLGCNEFAMPPDVPALFYWQSPGGGQVLTMYSKGGYGTGLLPPEDWPYPVWMALMHTHDNCGPQSAERIRELVAEAQDACPDAQIVCGTMDEFCRELERCDLSAVPVIRKDLADTWIHGAGSYPLEVSRMRQCRERSRQMHSAYCRRLLSGGAAIPELETLWDRYYDAVALFTEHTWGADVKTFLGPERVYGKEAFRKAKNTPPYQFLERSWQEQRDRAAEAERCLDAIAVLLPMPERQPTAAGAPLPAALAGSTLTVENACFRLSMDTRTGSIHSLSDSRTGQALLKAGSAGVFEYRYDRYGLSDVTEFLRSYGYHFTTWGIQDYGRENYPDCGHKTFFPTFSGWEIHGRTLCLHYRTGQSSREYGDAEALHLSVTFPEAGETLFITLELESKQESPFIESGSLAFPLDAQASFRIGKPGGVIDPEADICRCCNHALFNLERQVTALTAQGSVSVCAPDTPLFGIGSPGVYEYRKTYGANRESVLYFNLFNNMWGTNFPQWIGGRFQYRFALRANVDAPQIWAAALCRGDTDDIVPGMELLDTRVEDGAVYLLLRDLTGYAQRRQMCVPGAVLCLTDLLHNPVTEWSRERITFLSRPYGIQMLSVRRMTE